MNIKKIFKTLIITAAFAFIVNPLNVSAEEYTITVSDAWSDVNYIITLLEYNEDDVVHFVMEDGTEVQLDEAIWEQVKAEREFMKEQEAQNPDTESSEQSEEISDISDNNVIETPNEEVGIGTESEEEIEKFWVTFVANAVEGTSVDVNTNVVYSLINQYNNETTEITLNSDNGFKTQVQILGGDYYVEVTTIGDNNTPIMDTVMCETYSIEVLEDGNIIECDIYGSSSAEIIDEPVVEEPVVVEERNFWLDLLKNNIFFLILLGGCAAVLLYTKIKKDNQ